MITVKCYTFAEKAVWNEFIDKSKNGLFLFYRDYLEYHSDRFADFSLMFYESEKLVALLPANLESEVLYSHGGLTFGGFIIDSRMTATRMLLIFDALSKFASKHAICRLIYKVIPHIYHRMPAQEDLYAIFRFEGKLIRRDLSSVIKMANRLALAKGKKHGLAKAKKAELEVKQTKDFDTYMSLLEEVIRGHGAKPTHTLAELKLLVERFPQCIKLFAAYNREQMQAGVVVYEYGIVAHTQYMASSSSGKEVGALDLIIHELLEKYYKDINYFSFGISTEDQGLDLNHGLVSQKEMFGARSIVHDFYEIEFKDKNF